MTYNQLTIEDFIIKAKVTHGDFYDYSRSKYTTYHAKIEIMCPLHGKFQQRAKHHIAGRGCRKCANIVMKNKMTFWDDEKISFLIDNFEKMTYVKMSKILKCSKGTIYKKKTELKLKRKEKPKHAHIPSYWFRNMRNGAFNRNFCFEITENDVWNLFVKQRGKCALTNCKVFFSKKKGQTTASVDRIDSKKGYTLDNIQIVHKEINRLKMAFPEDMFVSMCIKVANNFKNKNMKRKITRWDLDILNDTEYPVFFDEAWPITSGF